MAIDEHSAPENRGERKERTRRAILDAALALSAESTLAAVSLRQVAKEVGIVPTAFYRHFATIDELGLALVEESFASLRAMVRAVRQGGPAPDEMIQRSMEVLGQHVRDQRAQFAFLTRERLSGPPRVRAAVHHQLELFERELAADLARITGPEWSNEDVQRLAGLFVSTNVRIVEELVANDRPTAERELLDRGAVQMRMIVVGAQQWRSDYAEGSSAKSD